jgi:hypothetical protein
VQAEAPHRGAAILHPDTSTGTAHAAATDKVLRPVHAKGAPSPRGASADSPKHVGDARAKAIFSMQGSAGGMGKGWRRPEADERVVVERWARRQPLGDRLLLMGLRRLGGTVKAVWGWYHRDRLWMSRRRNPGPFAGVRRTRIAGKWKEVGMRCSDTGLPGVQQPGAPVSPNFDAPFHSRHRTTARVGAGTEAPHHAGTGGTVGRREATRPTVPPARHRYRNPNLYRRPVVATQQRRRSRAAPRQGLRAASYTGSG